MLGHLRDDKLSIHTTNLCIIEIHEPLFIPLMYHSPPKSLSYRFTGARTLRTITRSSNRAHRDGGSVCIGIGIAEGCIDKGCSPWMRIGRCSLGYTRECTTDTRYPRQRRILPLRILTILLLMLLLRLKLVELL